MKRTASEWLTTLMVLMSAAISSQAMAALLAFQVSGQFATCGVSNLPPPCGAYGGTFVIDTGALASYVDPGGTFAFYPLHSASITLNQPTTVISGAPDVRISNESTDGLLFYVAGAGMEFKVSLTSPASTIGDYLLTEANVLALIGSATSKTAWAKYDPPSGGGPAILDAVSLNIEQVNIPEPSSLALIGLGLAGLAASRRRSQ